MARLAPKTAVSCGGGIMSNPLRSIQDTLAISQAKAAKLLGVSEQAVIRAAKGATARPVRIAAAAERAGLYSADLFLAEYSAWREQHTAKMRSRLERLQRVAARA